jgi:hypothetical protein
MHVIPRIGNPRKTGLRYWNEFFRLAFCHSLAQVDAPILPSGERQWRSGKEVGRADGPWE